MKGAARTFLAVAFGGILQTRMGSKEAASAFMPEESPSLPHLPVVISISIFPIQRSLKGSIVCSPRYFGDGHEIVFGSGGQIR